MNFNLIFSLFNKKSKAIKDEVTSISSLAPKILTKKEDLEKVQPYLDKLKDTLNAKGINNIALTGGYGSGKSTILNTFQHWNNDSYNFLNISLAAFNKKNGENTQKEELEKQLEISILQQIIYKVNPNKIPESRFRRIINIHPAKLFLISISTLLWIWSSILLFKYNYLDKLNPQNWDNNLAFDWGSFFISMITFTGFVFFSKWIVEVFSNSKINKVNLKGEIEIGDNSNKSILNEHYDEILYYFEKNNFNVVIIEDLDRFDNTNIFTKLRELNILLNNADSIKNRNCYKESGIKFLYAIGDDLFDDKKERVKFFEYIIPVIPFINSFNAYEQLKNLIKESDLEESVFSREFLSDITTFIDDIDMRLLINIFHEFVIYRNVLRADILKGNESNLFAMIVYKNIDPEDFNKLNNKEGKLYNLINNKKIYTKSLIDTKETQIKKNLTEIKDIKNENAISIKELRQIYINQILDKLPDQHPIYISDIEIKNLKEDGKFKELITSGKIVYRIKSNYNTYPSESETKFDFEKIQKEVNSNYTYTERVKLIESKNNNRITALQNEIDKLKSEKSEVENWDLKEIFKNVDINGYLNDFSNNALLRNLILEGYINENYNDYISLFHEVTLTKEDKIFEKNVKSGFKTNYEYKLTHIENLIGGINTKYFDRKVILNFDLLDYLGDNYTRYSNQYDAVIRVLNKENSNCFDFIDSYIENENRPLQIFFKKIVENLDWLWEYVYDNLSFEKQQKYLRLIIDHNEVDDVLEYQNKEILKKALEENINFVELIKTEDKTDYYTELKNKLIKIIENLDVKFESLDIENEKIGNLVEKIYENNHYKITKDNIFQILKARNINFNETDFETVNYSTIKKSKLDYLIKYIDININEYVESIFLNIESNQDENETYLIELLNNKKLILDNKISIIKKVKTKINYAESITDFKIFEYLLEYNKIEPKWENLLKVFNSNTISQEDKDEETTENKLSSIIGFINNKENSKELSKIKIPNEENNKDLYKVFWRKLIQQNEISDDCYDLILKSNPWWYSDLELEKLNETKIEYLISNNVLNPNKKNFDTLKENFEGLNIKLLEKHKNKYFEILNTIVIDEFDLENILNSKILNDSDKSKFIEVVNQNKIIKNPNILKSISDIILSKSPIKFDTEILNSIMLCNKISIVNRITIFSQNYNSNNVDFINNFLNGLGGIYSTITDKSKRQPITKNKNNEVLLTHLKKIGYISSYTPNEKDFRVNHKKIK